MTYTPRTPAPRKPFRVSRLPQIEKAFSRKALKRVCEMAEADFQFEYDMQRVAVDQPGDEDFFLFKDNGSNVLAVAHLDTVGDAADRVCRFVLTEGGTVVFSRALDDRLGAYIILELLPKLGITYDVLLTVGEESGQSTAAFFEPPSGKEYDYMIEFDRGGTDVVMYDYEDIETIDMVKACGARVGDGSFSDISYLEHLGIKGFNWGVGYRDYHGPRAHAFLDDTFLMVDHYLTFAKQNEGVAMPHYPRPALSGFGRISDDEYAVFGQPRGGWGAGDPSWFDDDPDLVDYNEDPTLEEIERAMDALGTA